MQNMKTISHLYNHTGFDFHENRQILTGQNAEDAYLGACLQELDWLFGQDAEQLPAWTCDCFLSNRNLTAGAALFPFGGSGLPSTASPKINFIGRWCPNPALQWAAGQGPALRNGPIIDSQFCV